MRGLRPYLLRHRVAAALLLAAALCLKALLPQGYMLGQDGARHLTVQLCFDGITHRTAEIVIPFKGSPGNDRDGQGKPDQSCPFTSLTMGTLGAVDLPLALVLLAFILALGFAPVRVPPLARRAFLQPPTRGPPAFL